MPNLAQVSGSAAVAAITALAGSGTLCFYSGAQPSTAETALSGNTMLVQFTFNSTAFGAPAVSGGYSKATASFVSATVTPAASGTVTFARMWKSDGVTSLGDFTVGTSATDIIIASTGISTSTSVNLSSFVLQLAVS
jgi:hypothetical protein